MGDAWSMVDGPLPGTGDRRLRSGYDDVRLRETTTAGAVDPTKPLVNPHTHHIRLTNVRIIWNITGCPAYAPPAVTTGFQLKGTVSLLTGNGSIAPFETDPPSSTLQVCVTGGNYTPVLDPEFEHYAGVRGARDDTLRAAGHSWRRAAVRGRKRPTIGRLFPIDRSSIWQLAGSRWRRMNRWWGCRDREKIFRHPPRTSPDAA